MHTIDPVLLHDLACVVHLHSTHSDGTGTVPEIVEAARSNSLDVVLLTDHDTLAGRSDEGWHGSVLLLVGQEISPPQRDHTLDFPGGPTFAAHPFSRGSERFRRFKGMPHSAPSSTTGIELWSYVTDTAERIGGFRDVARFVLTPERYVDHPPRRNLDEWDRMCASRRVVAIGGLDAHQIGIRVAGHVPLRLMSYRRSFRYLRTHVLCEEAPSGELEHDRAQVYGALAEGRCYIARDSLAAARGFAFWAETGDPRPDAGVVVMGAEAPAGEYVLRVRLPRPAEVRLVRDGRVVASAEAAQLDHEASGPGVYRVETRLRAHGRDRTWILSNPIYLR